MEEIEAPVHFLCPISMQVMKDPVTVSTGITYDRQSIERWIYSCKNSVCPVTKQPLSDTDLTPNDTLRRLIQGWCTLNSSRGFKMFSIPKPPVEKSQIVTLLNDAKQFPHTRIQCLRRIQSIARGSDRNRAFLEESGTIEFLASIIKNEEERESEILDNCLFGPNNITINEALRILHHFQDSDMALTKLTNGKDDIVNVFTRILRHGSNESRAYAIMLLTGMFDRAELLHSSAIASEIFVEIVDLLKDNISQQASKAALKLLLQLCSRGRNQIKATAAGAVPVLIDLLLDTCDRRACELMLGILDRICCCAEGRAEFLNHGAGLATVSKKILRVSHVASDLALRVVSSISKSSASSKVLQEMLEVGVVSKLCLVLRVDCSGKTKERAREVQRMHSRVWKDASCVPVHLLSSYPSP